MKRESYPIVEGCYFILNGQWMQVLGVDDEWVRVGPDVARHYGTEEKPPYGWMLIRDIPHPIVWPIREYEAPS